jgi:hypothetical protein
MRWLKKLGGWLGFGPYSRRALWQEQTRAIRALTAEVEGLELMLVRWRSKCILDANDLVGVLRRVERHLQRLVRPRSAGPLTWQIIQEVSTMDGDVFRVRITAPENEDKDVAQRQLTCTSVGRPTVTREFAGRSEFSVDLDFTQGEKVTATLIDYDDATPTPNPAPPVVLEFEVLDTTPPTAVAGLSVEILGETPADPAPPPAPEPEPIPDAGEVGEGGSIPVEPDPTVDQEPTA